MCTIWEAKTLKNCNSKRKKWFASSFLTGNQHSEIISSFVSRGSSLNTSHDFGDFKTPLYALRFVPFNYSLRNEIRLSFFNGLPPLDPTKGMMVWSTNYYYVRYSKVNNAILKYSTLLAFHRVLWSGILWGITRRWHLWTALRVSSSSWKYLPKNINFCDSHEL